MQSLGSVMANRLMSYGHDVLESRFTENKLSFIFFGDPILIDELKNLTPINELDYVLIPPLGVDKLEEARAYCRENEFNNPHITKQLFQISTVFSGFLVNVPDDCLSDFTETISWLYSDVTFASRVKYMAVANEFPDNVMPTNMESFFLIIDLLGTSVPCFFETIQVTGDEAEIIDYVQVFNHPSPELTDYPDGSVATLYGEECDWKVAKFDEKSQFSLINNWWGFTSKSLLKNRLNATVQENNLAEDVSLNTSAIKDLAWDIAKIKNVLGFDN